MISKIRMCTHDHYKLGDTVRLEDGSEFVLGTDELVAEAFRQRDTAQPTPGMICGNCHWFDAGSPKFEGIRDDRSGHCRRHSPVRLDRGPNGEWPFITAEDWCGEFMGRSL